MMKCLFFGRHDHSICEASQSRKERETADSQPQPSSSAIPVIPDAVGEVLEEAAERIANEADHYDNPDEHDIAEAERERVAVIRAFLASSPTVTRDQIARIIDPEAADYNFESEVHDLYEHAHAEAVWKKADAVLALLRGGAQ